MSSILLIVQLLAPVLINLLGESGVIPPSLTALISQIAAAIPTLVANLVKGGGVSADVQAVLLAVQSEINAVKNAGVLLDGNQVNEVTALEHAVSDALAAYSASRVTDDPSNLTELSVTL